MDFINDQEGFVIDNDLKAEWAIKKIAEEDAERIRLNDVCKQSIEFYTKEIENNDSRYENSIGYLRGQLFQYFSNVPHKETKTMESYKLPSGSLVMKKAKMELEHDDEILLPYVKENFPELVQVTEKVMWGELKKRLADMDGEVIDSETGLTVAGVKAVEKPESFEVKF